MALLSPAESLQSPHRHGEGVNLLEAYLRMLFKVSGPIIDFTLPATPKKK